MSPSAAGRRSDGYDPVVRCYLFYGPDDAGSRALAARIATAVGADAERVDLSPAQLRADPALLADEAASVSLFGAARHIRVDGAGDESVAAVEALMAAPVAGNPVVLIAGALKRDARLVKALDGDARAQVRVSYPPDTGDLARVATVAAAALGLRLHDDAARRLAETCGGDRAVMAREIEKLADYVDAAPDAPRTADESAIEAIGADNGDADLGATLDALFAGDLRALDDGLQRLAREGQDGVPLVRATQKRLLAMAAARAEMDRGASAGMAVERTGRALFKRERTSIARDLPRWPATRLAVALDRTAAAGRAIMSASGPGAIVVKQLFHAMARSVRR